MIVFNCVLPVFNKEYDDDDDDDGKVARFQILFLVIPITTQKSQNDDSKFDLSHDYYSRLHNQSPCSSKYSYPITSSQATLYVTFVQLALLKMGQLNYIFMHAQGIYKWLLFLVCIFHKR